MTLQINIQVSGLNEAIQWLDRFGEHLENPTMGLEYATHSMADVFARNYDGEGSEVGGWAELSEYTNRIREWQGFDPDHPVLVRSGALRAMAVEFFQTAMAGQTATAGDDFPAKTWSDQVVRGHLDIQDSGNGQTAVLSLGGSYKLLNQFGHANAFGYEDNPARPYWFITSASTTAARDGVIKWLQDEVLK